MVRIVPAINILHTNHCVGRIQSAINKSSPMSATEARSLSMLIFIVSLLAEHCNFDQLRADSSLDLKNVEAINAISKGPVTEHIYNSMLLLHEKFDNPALQARILQCLGRSQHFFSRPVAKPRIRLPIPCSTHPHDLGYLCKSDG
jgi:cohesin loading factor subunit SCC2